MNLRAVHCTEAGIERLWICAKHSWSDITLLHHPLLICWILLTSAADTVFLNQLPYMAKMAVIVDFA